MISTLVLGVFIGLIMALTGAGGGILAVPLLMFTTGLGVHEAAPIGLLAVGLAASFGTVLGLRVGEVRYKAATLMGFVGLLFSPLGFWVAHQIDTKLLNVAFAAVLFWVALNAFVAAPTTNKSSCPCILNPDTGRFIWILPCARALVFSGSIAGFLSGLLGVGGGFVLIPALQKFTHLTVQSMTATSLAVIAIVSTFGVLNSMNAGAFNYEIGAAFSAATLFGMLGGRLISKKIDAAILKKAFGVLCVLVAMLMLSRLR